MAAVQRTGSAYGMGGMACRKRQANRSGRGTPTAVDPRCGRSTRRRLARRGGARGVRPGRDAVGRTARACATHYTEGAGRGCPGDRDAVGCSPRPLDAGRLSGRLPGRARGREPGNAPEATRLRGILGRQESNASSGTRERSGDPQRVGPRLQARRSPPTRTTRERPANRPGSRPLARSQERHGRLARAIRARTRGVHQDGRGEGGWNRGR